MKLSIIIPIYYNEETLEMLYSDLKEKVLDIIDYDYEIIMVNDGSGDNSYQIMKNLKDLDPKIKIYSLSRNYGSHAAVLCGLEHSTGDCAVIKAADLQEPSEMILDMVKAWKKGNNVVLAIRKERKEGREQIFFANTYYWLVRKFALPKMPKNGFDIFLIDKKVIKVLSLLDERNSSITAQILWCGFKTIEVPYIRRERTVGSSKWTLKKKIRLVQDTMFSFSSTPINFISIIGGSSVFLSLLSCIITILLGRLVSGKINEFLIICEVLWFFFGVLACFLGIIGEYIWRTLDASRNRPVYIIEDRDER